MCEQITLHCILTCPIIHSSTMFIKVLTILLNISRFLTIKLVTSTNMASNRKEDEIPSTYNCLQCSSKFKQNFNRKKHVKSVHTQDEFQCDQCASSFGRKDDLEKHKRRKHTIKKCDECEFTTYKNIELANHVMRVHPPDDYTEKTAFNRKLVNIKFKIKDQTSPMETLENYLGKVKKILKHELEDKKMLKSYIGYPLNFISISN